MSFYFQIKKKKYKLIKIFFQTNYIKSNNFGGAMIFSLNTDDYQSSCLYGSSPPKEDQLENASSNGRFPLTRKINSILFKAFNSQNEQNTEKNL